MVWVLLCNQDSVAIPEVKNINSISCRLAMPQKEVNLA
jgi:hypothetical protein